MFIQSSVYSRSLIRRLTNISDRTIWCGIRNFGPLLYPPFRLPYLYKTRFELLQPHSNLRYLLLGSYCRCHGTDSSELESPHRTNNFTKIGSYVLTDFCEANDHPRHASGVSLPTSILSHPRKFQRSYKLKYTILPNKSQHLF